MSILESVTQNIEKVESLQADALQKISNAQDQAQQKINPSENIPNYRESINSIKGRLAGALTLFKSMDGNSSSYTLVPYNYLNGLNNSISKIASEFEKIIGGFSQLESNGGIGTINLSNYTFVSQNGQFNFDLPPLLTAIDTHIDNALDNYYKINFVFQRPDYSSLSGIVNEFTEALGELTAKKTELGKLLKAATDAKNKTEQASTAASSQLESIATTVKQIGDTKTDADNKLNQINEIQAKATQQAPIIEQVHQKATTLKQDVENYQQQFTQFQNELDSRVKKYNEGNKTLEELIKSLKDQSAEIERINQEATAALNFSTVAGLAKGFGDKKDDLATEQSKAYESFKNSLWLFFVSSLIPLGYLGVKIFGGGDIKLEELSMTLLPVIPAVVFTKFTASKHNNLFKLREHYAHKYSVSFSLKGFKDELETDKQKTLVEATFKDLATHNPADKIDSRDGGDKHPLPFWDTIASFFSPRK